MLELANGTHVCVHCLAQDDTAHVFRELDAGICKRCGKVKDPGFPEGLEIAFTGIQSAGKELSVLLWNKPLKHSVYVSVKAMKAVAERIAELEEIVSQNALTADDLTAWQKDPE
jgi:hypothetical protein